MTEAVGIDCEHLPPKRARLLVSPKKEEEEEVEERTASGEEIKVVGTTQPQKTAFSFNANSGNSNTSGIVDGAVVVKGRTEHHDHQDGQEQQAEKDVTKGLRNDDDENDNQSHSSSDGESSSSSSDTMGSGGSSGSGGGGGGSSSSSDMDEAELSGMLWPTRDGTKHDDPQLQMQALLHDMHAMREENAQHVERLNKRKTPY
jgi:hypothetical protein